MKEKHKGNSNNSENITDFTNNSESIDKPQMDSVIEIEKQASFKPDKKPMLKIEDNIVSRDLLNAARASLGISNQYENAIKTFTSSKNSVKITPELYGFFKKDSYSSLPIASHSFVQQITLQEEITKIKKELNEKLQELEQDNTKKIEELEDLKKKLNLKERINHILPRICEEARKKLFESEGFKKLFEDATICNSVVVAIDIRRSTELMLKARKPELFAKFITELSKKLSEIIINNYGVFDKFTGDGVLAFFPSFYSGKDAMYFALKAAKECHQVFNTHYNNSRDCFNVFIKNTGLGIGIDYGTVTLVNNHNELTVVGIPVVYACRMSGADAGLTILNQPAMEHVEFLYLNQVRITETEINIKNEGVAIAYLVDINERGLKIEKPNWDELIELSKESKKN